MNWWSNDPVAQPAPAPAGDDWWKRDKVAPSTESSTARGVGMGALGFNDSIADTLGMPVDLAALALRQVWDAPGLRKPLGGSQTFRDVFDYVATLPGRVSDAASTGSLGALTEARTARDAPQDLTEKLIYGGGRGLGGAAAMMVPAGALASVLPANTAAQGVARTMAAQPVMQAAAGTIGGAASEATGSPYAGMAAALALPVGMAAGRRALTPAGDAYMNEEQRRLAQVLASSGVPLTAGQATGAPFLRTIESGMKFHPLTSAVANADAQAQRGAFGRAVTGLTGDATDAVTPQWLQSTKDRLGSQFSDRARALTVNLDDQFAADAERVVTEYGRNLDALKRPVFDRIVKEVLSSGQQLPGQNYQKLRSTLGRLADGSSDPEFSQALGGLQRALDGAARRSMTPEQGAAWDALRSQYGAYKTIDQAMRATNAGSGEIPPTQLWMAARDRNNPQMRDLARAGQEFVRDTVPNSGTPQRLLTQGMITGGAGVGAVVDPITAAIAFGAPPALQAMMRSGPGRAYLQNNLMSGVESPLTGRLTANMFGQRQLEDMRGPGRR